jgi:hypothetical protein
VTEGVKPCISARGLGHSEFGENINVAEHVNNLQSGCSHVVISCQDGHYAKKINHEYHLDFPTGRKLENNFLKIDLKGLYDNIQEKDIKVVVGRNSWFVFPQSKLAEF